MKLFGSAWERLWSKDGLLPPLEFNQGLISLIVLILLFWAILAAHGRAARAEARANKADRERQREAQAAEAARLQILEESRAREAAAIEQAERNRRANQILQFVSAATGVIGGVINTLRTDQQRASEDGSLPRPSQPAKRQAQVASSSLVAILPTAPLNAGLITSTRDSALVLEILANTPAVVGDQADRLTADFTDLLTGAQQALRHHEQALLGELGFGQSASFAQGQVITPPPAA